MHLCPDGKCGFQDVNVPINKPQIVAQWFEQCDHNISHVSRPS